LNEFSEVSIDRNQSTLCLVGDDLRGTPGIAARVFTAISRKGVNITMISQGASELNIGIIVAEQDLRPAVEALHAELFSELDPAVFE
jgi:aspartate kinase